MRSREFDRDFRDGAVRTRAWGVGLMAVAGLLWTWCVLLLLTPYEVDRKPDDQYPRACESRLLTEYGTANEGLVRGDYCENERDWPEAVALLGLSVPVSVTGAVLFTIGSVSLRMSAHAEAMRELDRMATEREARQARP